MKNVVFTIILIACLFLDSCDPAASFDIPQPENVKPLATFSRRLQGKYMAADQASIITITDNLIIRHYDIDCKEHKDSLGPSYKIIGDTLIDMDDGTKERILLKGDSVIGHVNWIDTLFNLSTGDILKKFKGFYFLNNRYGDKAWEVKKMSLAKGLLTLGSVSSKEDIQKLKEITETTADTISTNFSLTKRQFKSFVRQEGFSDQETFTRMTENSK